MNQRIIRIAAPGGWTVSTRAGHADYPQGDYVVPDDMPPDHARRCINSGYGQEIQRPLETKGGKKRRKKKRSTTKTGNDAAS